VPERAGECPGPVSPGRLASHPRRKTQNLDDLYQLLQHDQNNRWMMILEATIVLLFIIDLLLLVAGLHRP
jgi:hypothetical protein